MRSIRADGTEYQVVIVSRSTNETSSAPKYAWSSGTGTTVAPTLADRYRSNTDRSKWSGAWLAKTSSGPTESEPAHQRMNVKACR